MKNVSGKMPEKEIEIPPINKLNTSTIKTVLFKCRHFSDEKKIEIRFNQQTGNKWQSLQRFNF